MVEIKGKGGVEVQVIADSISPNNDRFTSLRLVYGRVAHSELLRHRVFSHSVSSSRAIPVQKVIKQVEENPFVPFWWGKNQPGMSAYEQIKYPETAKEYWYEGVNDAVSTANFLDGLSVHKQVVNRVLEPFQFITEIMSGTDFDNFFGLRIHKDSDPVIHELALCIYEAMQISEPTLISHGEYHMPYIEKRGGEYFAFDNNKPLTQEEAIKVSMSCVAQTSYRNLDTSLEKAIAIGDKLLSSRPVHASPAESIATPFSDHEYKVRERLKAEMSLQLQHCNYSKQQAEQEANRVMYSRHLRGWTPYRVNLKDDTINNKFTCDIEKEKNRWNQP